jgi:hypothetical protein
MAMATQRFKLRETIPGLPGEWVCAGCEQPMTMGEPGGESPAAAAEIDHKAGCPEVRRLAAG